jgi:hypothetical protein
MKTGISVCPYPNVVEAGIEAPSMFGIRVLTSLKNMPSPGVMSCTDW